MAEKPNKPAKGASIAAKAAAPPPGGPAAPAGTSPGPATWRTAWQLPALIGAVMLLGGGVGWAILSAPKPNFDKMFEQVEGLIEHEEYQQALDVLNQRMTPYYNAQQLAPGQGRHYHLLRARAVYLEDRKLGVENEKNAEHVVDEYAEAVPEGTALEPRDQFFLADANVTLGRMDRALQLAATLPATERANRGRIVKRVVERRLETPSVDADETLRLLADFLKDQQLSVADRAWALARQAELLLHQGLNERAIAKLVQTMPALLAEAGPDHLADLYLLLGRAYWETAAFQDSARQLEQASALMTEVDPLRSEAEVLLARIYDQTHQPPEEAHAEAKQRFEGALARFESAPAALGAMLGLGEVCAVMGETQESLQAYARLVAALGAGRKGPDVSRGAVATSLLDRFGAKLESGDLPSALRYATLAEQLFAHDDVPPEVLLALATAHRNSADVRLKEPGSKAPIELADLDPATREQVRLDLITASQYYKRHADRVGISDNTAYGSSLWLAADCSDLAGDPDQAIPLFLDFVKFFPNEPRQGEARFRLGQSYQAKGDYGMAAQFYRALIQDNTSRDRSTGPYGDLSYVPLAQALLSDGDPGNDAEAEKLLEEVVTGRTGDTTSRQYRDALVELGQMHRRRGEYARAITRLDEAIRRFPDDERIDDLRFELGDACRQDARAINRKLDEGMPDNRKQALREARLERLRMGRELFEQVRRSLEGRDGRRLTRLEQLELRNSYFYLGDCAFDLKEFETAIHHYDAARERYPKDPASLVAMIQIVNAYIEMGDTQRALTANNRAKAFYESLPASSWNDPDLPIDRADWQRWLDSMAQLRPGGVDERPRAAEPER